MKTAVWIAAGVACIGAVFLALRLSGAGPQPPEAAARVESVDVQPASAASREPAGAGDASSVPASNVQRIVDARENEPAYAQPDVIESLVLETLAQARLNVVSINSVRCDRATCEIAMQGATVNPRVVDGVAEAGSTLFRSPSRAFRLLNSSTSTREVAPGVREYVIKFTYQPLVDLSHDPTVAARQQAACAAAWRRQTTNPTPEEYVRQYLSIAEQHLALAAVELGRKEAERIAAETDLGPLIRECGLQPL
jgi:hypothetical protein